MAWFAGCDVGCGAEFCGRLMGGSGQTEGVQCQNLKRLCMDARFFKTWSLTSREWTQPVGAGSRMDAVFR